MYNIIDIFYFPTELRSLVKFLTFSQCVSFSLALVLVLSVLLILRTARSVLLSIYLPLPLSISASLPLSCPFSRIKIGFRRIVALSFANFSTPHTDAHCVFMGGAGGGAGLTSV